MGSSVMQSTVKCPRCKSNNLVLTEVWTGHTIEWEQEGGVIDKNKGSSEPGDPYTVNGLCKDCFHEWKLKGVIQITQVLKEVNNNAEK